MTVIGCALLVLGAVNNPLEEIVPALADQVTAVLLVLLTARRTGSSRQPQSTDLMAKSEL